MTAWMIHLPARVSDYYEELITTSFMSFALIDNDDQIDAEGLTQFIEKL